MQIKYTIMATILTIFVLISCNNIDQPTDKKPLTTMDSSEEKSVCCDDCQAKHKTSKLSCKLTTPELQKRKETVLATLKTQVAEKKRT